MVSNFKAVLLGWDRKVKIGGKCEHFMAFTAVVYIFFLSAWGVISFHLWCNLHAMTYHFRRKNFTMGTLAWVIATMSQYFSVGNQRQCTSVEKYRHTSVSSLHADIK